MTQTITFDNFQGGEYGSKGPRNPPPGTFHGLNVSVFTDGTIGPRAGISQAQGGAAPASKLCAGSIIDAGALGPRAVIGGSAANGLSQIQSAAGVSASVIVGPGAAYPSFVPYRNSAGTDQILVPGTANVVAVSPAAGTSAVIAGSPILRLISSYGSRIIGVTVAAKHQLVFSSPNDPSVWPALNFIWVGSDYTPIVGLFPSRDRLFIAKADGSWWVLTGTLGVNEHDRCIYRGHRIVDDSNGPYGVVTPSGDLLFSPYGYTNPAIFTGASVQDLRHLPLGTGIEWMRLRGPSDAFCRTSSGALMRRNGIWTEHSFPVAVDNLTTSCRMTPFALTGVLSVAGADNLWRQLWIDLDRPGYSDKNGLNPNIIDYLDAGSTMTTLLELPQWWTSDGSEVLVRRVQIDYLRWDVEVTMAFTSHMEVQVDAVGRHSAPGPTSSALQSVDKTPATWGATAGIPDRAELFFGDQGYGQGFQIRFSGMRGVAIHSVTVEVEQVPG